MPRMICSCVYGEPVKEPAMYTTARASGNSDKSKLNETEAARRLPLSAPNSFNDSFNSGIILLFIDLPRIIITPLLRDSYLESCLQLPNICVTINSNKVKGGTIMIEVGSKAPDFTLKDQNGKTVRLSSLKGKRVLLSFRPLAWTPV